MLLILTSLALGILLAWRGGAMALVGGAWAVAGIIACSLLFGTGTLVDPLPTIALTLFGYNAGAATGLGLNFVAGMRATRS